MKFRIFIIKDPEAKHRGFSLKGIKVPMTSWCPLRKPQGLVDCHNKPIKHSLYEEFWKIPVELLCNARPELWKHLKGVDFLTVPVAWCDVAPVDSYDRM